MDWNPRLRRRRTELLVSVPPLPNATASEIAPNPEQTHNFGEIVNEERDSSEVSTPPTTGNVFQPSRSQVPPPSENDIETSQSAAAVPFNPALALTPPVFSSHVNSSSFTKEEPTSLYNEPPLPSSLSMTGFSVNNKDEGVSRPPSHSPDGPSQSSSVPFDPALVLTPPIFPAHHVSSNSTEEQPTLYQAPPTPARPSSMTISANTKEDEAVPRPTPLLLPLATTNKHPSTLLLPTVSSEPPQQRLASPPPFDIIKEPPCRDTLSCLSMAQIAVLAALLVSLCCCLRCLASCMHRGTSSGSAKQRGVYRRIVTDEYDADAFYDGFDEDDDIFFEDAAAIELNDMDRMGDSLALEEVNG